MPTPGEGELVTPNPGDWPSFRVAAYLPALHEDGDEDGLQGPGEAYVGIGMAWPLYAVNVPAELAMAGVVEGWNALEMEPEGEGFELHEIDDIPLEAGLWPERSASLGGRYGGDLPAGTQGLAVVPMVAFEGAPISSLVHEETPLPEAFAIELEGEPPADHFYQDADLGLAMGIEVPLAYLDVDLSGGLSAGDAPTYLSCYDGLAVMAIWVQPPEELLSAFTAQALSAAYGLNMGWWVGSIDPRTDEPQSLGREARQNLVLDGSCSLE
jgi:hypothetical protein